MLSGDDVANKHDRAKRMPTLRDAMATGLATIIAAYLTIEGTCVELDNRDFLTGLSVGSSTDRQSCATDRPGEEAQGSGGASIA